MMTQTKPSDDEMRRMMERCNDTGLSYPPELLEWIKEQRKLKNIR